MFDADSDSYIPAMFHGGEVEVTKLVNGIRDKKITDKVVFWPFLWHPWSDLAKNFVGSLLPASHLSVKFCPNPSSFLRDKCRNVFYNRYNICVKPVVFSLIIIVTSTKHVHCLNHYYAYICVCVKYVK